MPHEQYQCFHVCANHFSPDCFITEGQYKACFAKKLLLKKRICTNYSSSYCTSRRSECKV